MSFKVLIISPYDALSHQYWRTALESFLVRAYAADVETVTLPARFFSWRFRGNSLTLSHEPRLRTVFDLVIATSMTDLATLRGLVPEIQDAPVALYFHENQFAYPGSERERQVERQITSIYSAMSADRLVFNSEFNRSTFVQGAAELLKRMPDGVPSGVIDGLQEKSEVISVPIQPATDPIEKARQLNIVWNHRWEYDKGLDELIELIPKLFQINDFTFHLIGQKFRQVPKQIEKVRALLGDHLGEFGFVPNRQDYLSLLSRSHIVLSTAKHEFQGIAVLEAMAAGCFPVVPDDLAYVEFVPSEYRYQNAADAAAAIAEIDQKRQISDSRSVISSLPIGVTPEQVETNWRSLITRLSQS